MPKKPRADCLNCGLEVKRANGRYCSNACQQARQKQKRLDRIVKTGDLSESFRSVRAAKQALLKIDGVKCVICGRKTWNGQKVPLVMDHIDGNADNWKLENLRLVCGNCDMQLPTYKNKNAGRGRYSRRQRYAAGKSF